MSNDDAHIRLIQAVEYLRNNGKARTHQEIADLMGARQPHVTSAINGDPKRLTKGFLKRFAAAYSDYIDEDWLLTGDGRMEKPDRRNSRPHIPADKATVSAGLIGTAINSVQDGECEIRPLMIPFQRYDFTIEVKGDSMLPTLQDKDVIACQWITDINQLNPSKIYVVDTKDGAVVKRLTIQGDEFLCHSDNPAPEYEDFTVPAASVLKVARVVGVVREL